MSEHHVVPELTPAIRGLYSAFRRRGAAPRVVGCWCCTSPHEFDHLARTPLQHLSAKQLDRYARKAITTVGTVEDFRYFLPRIVEAAVGGDLLVDREVVFGKLRRGNWRGWPLHEQEAVETFARAVAGTFASIEYEPGELDEWVCSLGQFVDDLRVFLEPLLSGTAVAKVNLLSLREHNADATDPLELSNAFWEQAPENASIFTVWLQTPTVRWAAG